MPGKSSIVKTRGQSHRILEILSEKWPKTVDARQVECTICKCNCEEGDICRLTCAHMFHRTCLIQWALEGENSCPNCKLLFCEAALYREGNLVRSMCIEERRQGDGEPPPKRISSSKNNANPATSSGNGAATRHPASSSSKCPGAASSSVGHTNGVSTKHPATSSSAIASRTNNHPASPQGDAAHGSRRPRSTSSSLAMAQHDVKDRPRRTKKQKILERSDKDLHASRCLRSRAHTEASNNVEDPASHPATESDKSESPRAKAALEKKRKKRKLAAEGKKHIAWAKKDQQAFLRRVERQEEEKEAKSSVARVEVPEWMEVMDDKVSVKLDGHGLENRGATVLGNKFRQIFPQLPNGVAHDLLLGNNAITHDGVNGFLQAAPTWNLLSLVSNNMGDAEIEAIRPLLRYYKISTVDLSDNHITTRGLKPMLLDQRVHTKWFIITRNKLQFVDQLLSAVEVSICLGKDATLCQGPSKHCGAELHLIGAFDQPSHLEDEESPDAPDLNDDNDDCYDDDFQLAQDRVKMVCAEKTGKEKKILPASGNIPPTSRITEECERVRQKPLPSNSRRQKELLTMGHRHRIAVDGNDNDEAWNFHNLSSDALREAEKQDSQDKSWIDKLGRVAYTKAVDMRFETTLERSPPRTSQKAVVPVVAPEMQAASVFAVKSSAEKHKKLEPKKMKLGRYARIDNMLLQDVVAKKHVHPEKMMELLRRAVEEFPEFETEADTKAFLEDPICMQKFDRFIFQFVPLAPEHKLKLYIKDHTKKWAERISDLKPHEIVSIRRDLVSKVIRTFHTPNLSWDDFMANKQSVRKLAKYLSSELYQRIPNAQNKRTSRKPRQTSEDSDDAMMDDSCARRLSPLRPESPPREKSSASKKPPPKESSIPIPAEWRSPDTPHSSSSAPSPKPVSPKEPTPALDSGGRSPFRNSSLCPQMAAKTPRVRRRSRSSSKNRSLQPAYTLSSPVSPGEDGGMPADPCSSSPSVAESSKHDADRKRRFERASSGRSKEPRPASPSVTVLEPGSRSTATASAPSAGTSGERGVAPAAGAHANREPEVVPAAGARGHVTVNQPRDTGDVPSQVRQQVQIGTAPLQVNRQQNAGNVPSNVNQQWDAGNIMAQQAMLPPWLQQEQQVWMVNVLRQQQQQQQQQLSQAQVQTRSASSAPATDLSTGDFPLDLLTLPGIPRDIPYRTNSADVSNRSAVSRTHISGDNMTTVLPTINVYSPDHRSSKHPKANPQ
eukprot:GEMP01001013.1.p1 GENE.GEMP01001013.1~~GEMP01001013.1.p1  ORF type:complete len:1234 (+),score=293.48 GEMP01001013.1:107-3808(+)